MTHETEDLVRVIAEELTQPVPEAARVLSQCLRDRYGDAVVAILLYGSCLRTGDDEGVLDLYVLVDRYRTIYTNPILAVLNTLLPPNVFYLETSLHGRTVRTKYAVLSLAAFVRATSQRTFESYFWARFAQPCALLYAARPAIADQVSTAMAAAVVTLVRRSMPLVPERFRLTDLWNTALTETYRVELRAERPGVSGKLYTAATDRYARVTQLALSRLPYPATFETIVNEMWIAARIPSRERWVTRHLWRLRRVQGKVLSLLRILRNALTFDSGVDYIMWKIERHSGVKADPTWREKRFRLLALGREVWRLYRKRAFR